MMPFPRYGAMHDRLRRVPAEHVAAAARRINRAITGQTGQKIEVNARVTAGRRIWDRAAEMVLLAGPTRKRADAQEATRQMLVALGHAQQATLHQLRGRTRSRLAFCIN
jgi:hypothetical protein